MTSHPIEANSFAWWLCCGKWRRLHAIPGAVLTVEEMRDAIDQGELVAARAACTLRRRWSMPGISSRLNAPHCAACCHALGIPAGRGTPANTQESQ